MLGIALLDLSPLLHKFDILLHQLQARLRVLLDDVKLVLQTKKGLERGSEQTKSELQMVFLVNRRQMWTAPTGDRVFHMMVMTLCEE